MLRIRPGEDNIYPTHESRSKTNILLFDFTENRREKVRSLFTQVVVSPPSLYGA